MAALRGGESWPELRFLGAVTLKLYETSEWISRRVETVTLIDTSRVERLVSLDIDHDRLRSILASAARDQVADEHPVIDVPLGLLPKQLLLDLAVRDASGSTLSLVTSSVDSESAAALLLAKLDELKHPMDDFADIFVANLKRITRDNPEANDRDAIGQAGEVTSWVLRDRAGGDIPDGDPLKAKWNALFADNEVRPFVELTATFTLNYMPMVALRLDRGVHVLNYRQIERQEPPNKPGWGHRLSLDSYSQRVEAPAFGFCAREHLRFEAPPGLLLEEFYLRRRSLGAATAKGTTLSASMPAPHTGNPVPARTSPRPAQNWEYEYQNRVTPERGVIYTTKIPPAPGVEVVALLRPRVAGFLRPAQYTVFATMSLLVGGAMAQGFGDRLASGRSSTEGAVALLLVVPSIMSAFLAREGEHELLSDLLRWPRILVSGSAIAALAAGSALVIQISGWRLAVVWFVAGGLNLMVWCLLVRISNLSKRNLAKSARFASLTLPQTARAAAGHGPGRQRWRRKGAGGAT